MKINRQSIAPGESIKLSDVNDNKIFREYRIIARLGMGTSCIAYYAVFLSGGQEHSCILKELYPGDCGLIREHDAVTLTFEQRDASEQDITDNLKSRYSDIRRRYIEAYDIQRSYRSRKGSNISDGDSGMMMAVGVSAPRGIYENKYGVLYTEYEYTDGIDYCSYRDEKSISDTVDIIVQTGEMISEFHRNGYLVLDIKEENILITGGVNHRTAVLFDFGSFVQKDSLSEFSFNGSEDSCQISFTSSGSDDLMPPELFMFRKYYQENSLRQAETVIRETCSKYGEKTDVYLLAAILFRRLFGKAENAEKIRRGAEWKLPDKSVFIMDETLRTELKKIFDRAFSKRARDRFTMSEFTAALLRLDYTASNEMNEKNIFPALQCHLYNHPLYRNIPQEKDTVNLLIAGFGKFGRSFLDSVLPVVQMPGKTINVLIVSGDKSEWKEYLDGRPELCRFFAVDRQLSSDDEYGRITFREHRFSFGTPEQNEAFMEELYEKENFTPDYTFVSVGRNSYNRTLAAILKKYSPVSYVSEGAGRTEAAQDGIIPVYVSEDVSDNPAFSEMERMAFNVHIIWNRNLNIKFSEVMNEFRKPYNYNSCLSFVTAMKYKLYGVGTDLSDLNAEEAARIYSRYIKENKEGRTELIYLEHRRWVTEKICAGYTHIPDLEDCAQGKPKDEKNRRHGCIVKSRRDNLLGEGIWTDEKTGKPDKKMWDNPPAEELEKLDELDRMSVELHRVYYRHAQKIKRDDIFNGSIVSEIKSIIRDDRECRTAFSELIFCMKSISQDESEQCCRYEGLCSAFLSSLKKSSVISNSSKTETERLLDTLRTRFYTVYASQLYQNYKHEDEKLVDGIPFIITYSESLGVVIPYNTGNNSDVFGNLAVPAVLNPAEITYICWVADELTLAAVFSSASKMTGFFRKKEIRSVTEFIIGYDTDAFSENESEIKKRCKLHLPEDTGVRLIPVHSRRECAEKMKSVLLEKSCENRYCIFEENDTPLSCVLDGTGFYSEVSSFRFNSAEMKFTAINNCDIVKYPDLKPYITVSEMFAFRKSVCTSEEKPEFYDDFYGLWDEYCRNTEAWRMLCDLLNDYSMDNDCAGVLKCRVESDDVQNVKAAVFPENRAAVQSVVDVLISAGAADPESGIEKSTNGSCRLNLYCHGEENKEILKKWIKHRYVSRIRCVADTGRRELKLIFDNYDVENLDCSRLGEAGREILEYLYDHEFIEDYEYNDRTHTACFSYSSKQIKNLLTSREKILDIYIYYQAKETGEFDDIMKDVKVDWENDLAVSCFDCILTKGFSSVFLECRSVNEIESDFYTGIFSMSEHFGINALTVFVADTQDSEDTEKINEIQRKFGQEFNVVTISSRDEIKNIGRKIVSLLQ